MRGQQPIKIANKIYKSQDFQRFSDLERIYGKYTANIVYSHYSLVLEYTKTRIYGKYTEYFESEDLRF